MPRPYLAVPVLSVGWKDSPRPSIDPGPFGSEMLLGETPFLSAANASPMLITSTTSEQQKAPRRIDRFTWLSSWRNCIEFLVSLVEFSRAGGLIHDLDLFEADGVGVLSPFAPRLHEVGVAMHVRETGAVAGLMCGGTLRAHIILPGVMLVRGIASIHLVGCWLPNDACRDIYHLGAADRGAGCVVCSLSESVHNPE